ncbi:DUF4333 domain-containing protein [Nocardia spumae]|uniref:DUF4333 domain-containing protein n=1 Tax=Nocardia spumae TaxID=2887190 RepID=UPI001D1574F5|nr:DUF4333 domain-containing protein [Nocardia spumae]
MSGPYGPNETPGPGEGHSGDPTQQWSGQPQPGQPGPSPQWGGQPQQPQQWSQPAPPQQQQWGQQPQAPQPQWGQQSQPSWPQQPPAQPQPWEPTQQQWGQPPQPSQQQWSQPTQSQQQWNQQPPADQPQQQWGMQEPQLTTTPTKKSKKGLLFGGIGVLVVVVVAVVLAFVFLGSDKLDNKAVQDGVQKVLKDSYGIDDVESVSCPSGQKVSVGGTFDCTLEVGGEQKKVTVKITKDDGTYEVGRPN